MKSSLLKAVQIALAAGVLALAVVLALPVRQAPLSPSTGSAGAVPAGGGAQAEKRPAPADISTVLLLFGVTGQSRPQATPAPSPTPGAKAPVEAPWLTYIGYATQDGIQYYMVKDTRSNKMIKVAAGVSASGGAAGGGGVGAGAGGGGVGAGAATAGGGGATTGGWSLVEVGAASITLRNNADTYIVKKR